MDRVIYHRVMGILCNICANALDANQHTCTRQYDEDRYKCEHILPYYKKIDALYSKKDLQG